MLARPELHSRLQYSFAGSITLVFASGVASALDSLNCAVSGASSGRGEQPVQNRCRDHARNTLRRLSDRSWLPPGGYGDGSNRNVLVKLRNTRAHSEYSGSSEWIVIDAPSNTRPDMLLRLSR